MGGLGPGNLILFELMFGENLGKNCLLSIIDLIKFEFISGPIGIILIEKY